MGIPGQTLAYETALECESALEGEISLTWEPVTDADGYELWHYLAAGSYYSDDTEEVGDNVHDLLQETACQLRVCRGTTYYFSVRAYAYYTYYRTWSEFSNEASSTLDDGWAPTVVDTTPADGEADLDVETMIEARFSESMDWASIDGTNFVLEDAYGDPVPASIGYNEATKTATLAPNLPLAPEATYTARLTGEPHGPQDVAGNSLAFDEIWSFTTSRLLSLWSDSHLPAYPSYPDGRAVELGVKFTSDVDGIIKGIRFYKGHGNSGPHVANLWSSDGERLASVTFVDETDNGWQRVDFRTPVPIDANTTYVASYYAPDGYYAADLAYFAEAGVDKWPLHAPPDGVRGSNGVYVYAESSAFPTDTYNSNNYWVDILFEIGSSPAGGSPARPIGREY